MTLWAEANQGKYHLAMFGCHRHSRSGDMYLVCHVILKDHMIKGSWDFMGGSPHSYRCSQDLHQPLGDIFRNFDNDVIIMVLMSLYDSDDLREKHEKFKVLYYLVKLIYRWTVWNIGIFCTNIILHMDFHVLQVQSLKNSEVNIFIQWTVLHVS